MKNFEEIVKSGNVEEMMQIVVGATAYRNARLLGEKVGELFLVKTDEQVGYITVIIENKHVVLARFVIESEATVWTGEIRANYEVGESISSDALVSVEPYVLHERLEKLVEIGSVAAMDELIYGLLAYRNACILGLEVGLLNNFQDHNNRWYFVAKVNEEYRVLSPIPSYGTLQGRVYADVDKKLWYSMGDTLSKKDEAYAKPFVAIHLMFNSDAHQPCVYDENRRGE